MMNDETLRSAQRASAGQPDDHMLAARASNEARRQGLDPPRVSARQMERSGHKRTQLIRETMYPDQFDSMGNQWLSERGRSEERRVGKECRL